MSLPEYKLIRSKRKTISLEITRQLEIVVRAPERARREDIERFLVQKRAWIEKHYAMAEHRAQAHPEPSQEQIQAYIDKAKQYLPQRVRYYAGIMELYPTAVTITGAKTRFGSCSGKNRICFSWRLMQYPADAIDYVVVHELAHIRHKNHGREFYALIESILPDYKNREKLLRQ